MSKYLVVEREWLEWMIQLIDDGPVHSIESALEEYPNSVLPLPASAQFAGEMEKGIEIAIKALYESVERADVKNLPRLAADAIQELQALRDKIKAAREEA